MSEVAIDWNALAEAALAVRDRAYAPYSGYAVGAAVLTEDGRVFVGCNVENASYGISLCAERNALGAAVAAGALKFAAIVVVASGNEPATPCGMCRQALAEHAPSFPVQCRTLDGKILDTSVIELLPHAFGPASLDVEGD